VASKGPTPNPASLAGSYVAAQDATPSAQVLLRSRALERRNTQNKNALQLSVAYAS